MATLTFRLPNRFQEVHPYMRYLVAVDEERHLRVYDWHKFVADAAEILNNLPAWSALARNDQLTEDQELPPAPQELPELTHDYLVDTVELGMSSVIDLTVYNRAAYVAGPRSVVCIPLQINGGYDQSLPTQVIAEVVATQVRAKGGVVVLPCGDEGMKAERVYLWQGQGEGLPPIHFSSPKETTRASWLYFNLFRFNHLGPAEILTNETVHEAALEVGGAANKRAITNFGAHGKSFAEMESLVPGLGPVQFHGGFASNNRIYAWRGNELRAWAYEGANMRVATAKSTTLPCRQIYGGMSFSRGLVLDTDAGTQLIDARWLSAELISPGENLTARAFTASVYYDRSVWSVKPDYVDISIVV